MTSPLLGGINRIDFQTSDVVTATLHIHDEIVERVPYLQVQKKRWTSEHNVLKLELPEGVCIEAAALVFHELYCPGRMPRSRGVAMSKQMVQVASMMDCSADLVEGLCKALQNSVSSDDDVRAFCEYCVSHEVPKVLSDVASRFERKGAEELDERQLLNLLTKGINEHESTVLKVAHTCLKKWSRRGGSSQEAVARILKQVAQYVWLSFRSGRIGESILEWAAEFAEKYQAFYHGIAQATFDASVLKLYVYDREDAEKFRPYLAKWFRRFASIGLQHSEDEFLSFCKIASGPALAEITAPSRSGKSVVVLMSQKILIVEECLQEFISILPQMQRTTQVRVWEVLFASMDGTCDWTKLVRLEVLQTLVVEAKHAFIERVVERIERIGTNDLVLADWARRNVTLPLLEHFHHAAKQTCC